MRKGEVGKHHLSGPDTISDGLKDILTGREKGDSSGLEIERVNEFKELVGTGTVPGGTPVDIPLEQFGQNGVIRSMLVRADQQVRGLFQCEKAVLFPEHSKLPKGIVRGVGDLYEWLVNHRGLILMFGVDRCSRAARHDGSHSS